MSQGHVGATQLLLWQAVRTACARSGSAIAQHTGSRNDLQTPRRNTGGLRATTSQETPCSSPLAMAVVPTYLLESSNGGCTLLLALADGEGSSSLSCRPSKTFTA